MRKATLCFLLKEKEILLGFKKKKWGEGKWNGFGGKVEDGESVKEAALRELKEECGVDAADAEKFAVIEFILPHDPEHDQQVHVFVARKWKGEPHESDEMIPKWFPLNAMPFDNMWPDDKIWLPKILKGEKFTAEFRFDGKMEIVSHRFSDLDKN